MRRLTLLDLWLVLDNLVQFRMEPIRALAFGEHYETQIRELHAKIGALPEIDAGRPFAREMADTDAQHDDFGRAIDCLLQAYEALGDTVPPQIRDVIREARSHVLSAPSDLKASYVDQALRARQRRSKMEDLAEPFAQIPLAGVGTLYDLVEAFTAQGEALDHLIHKRGEVESIRDRSATDLRGQVLSVVNDIKQSIKLQTKKDERVGGPPSIPANADGLIFGYAQALLQLRSSGNSSSKPEDDLVVPSNADDSPMTDPVSDPS